jgi:hypothetical protein
MVPRLPISACASVLEGVYAEVIPGSESTIVTEIAADFPNLTSTEGTLMPGCDSPTENNYASQLQQSWTDPPSNDANKPALDSATMQVKLKVIETASQSPWDPQCVLDGTPTGVPPPSVNLSHSSCTQALK